MKIKTVFFLFLLFSSLKSYSQISVSSTHVGKAKKFKKGILEKFKDSKTIFVLSNIYDVDVYKSILEKSWKVTPFEVVDAGEFEIEEYLTENYSIVELSGYTVTTQRATGIPLITEKMGEFLYTFIDLRMYDNETIRKKLSKLSPQQRRKRRYDIINDNCQSIARLYTFPNDKFIHTSRFKKKEEVLLSMYTDDYFFNYNPGFLKNYFQRMSDLLVCEEICFVYGDDYKPELKKLSSKKLYIPSYISIKYDGFKGVDSEKDPNHIKAIFKDYDFKYEMISDEDISTKILSGEEFYYLRYVRVNAQKFIQVVNSKTGDVIYRQYATGFSYNLKSKHISELNSKIRKAKKKFKTMAI